MTKPAATLAMAPVVRFAVLESFGRAEEVRGVVVVVVAFWGLVVVEDNAKGVPVCRRPWRRALRLVK